jgi:hypothetical protein
LKIAHWSFFNGSGLTNMAVLMNNAEKKLGSESVICNTSDVNTWAAGRDADIHVVHSHIPDDIIFNEKSKIVAVQHGAPMHVFDESVRQGLTGNYGASDSLAMIGYLMRRANAVVTFWPRHEDIYRRMTSAPVHCVPMGVDKTFWQPVPKVKLLSGTPAILTAENCHSCKWPLDAIFMWPNIVEKVPTARMHFINIPYDQHRWWLPLSYMTTARYTTYISATKLPSDQLRSFVCASDYYYSPVSYGDFNMMSLEANACGAKIISYRGNVFADYWITEGDQREQADEFLNIIQGKRDPRAVQSVPDIEETAGRMLEIYKGM